MSSDSLRTAVEAYGSAIAAFQASPAPETVLGMLVARDRIEALNADQSELPDPATLLQILSLDEQVRGLAGKIHSTVNLEAWQASFQPPETAWWWWLSKPVHRYDRYDWVWSTFTVATLAASASLVVEICSKFLTGAGPGLFGSFAVIGQSLLTLATAGGVLTEGGRRAIEEAMESLGIGRHWWQETKLGLSIALLLGLVGFHSTLPRISEQLSEAAQTAEAEGNYAQAEAKYQRAISLNEGNAEAYYNLGQLYTDWGKTELARDQFVLAARGGYWPAFNGLANFYLLAGDPGEAASIAIDALAQIPDTPDTQALRAELSSNLGWARFQQGRYPEAQDHLEQALALETQSALPPDPEAGESPDAVITLSSDDGKSVCLLAQVSIAEDSPEAAAAAAQCVAIADRSDPTQDAWAYIAETYLAQGRVPERFPITGESQGNVPSTGDDDD